MNQLTCSFTSHAWITNSCPITGHALAANLTPQSVVDKNKLLISHLLSSKEFFLVLTISKKKMTKNIAMKKTYSIRKVMGEGGQPGL